MKNLICWTVALAVMAVCSTSLAADGDKPEKPKRNPAKIFKKLDADSNGALTLEEFIGKRDGEKKTKAEAMFKKKDKDENGSLSMEEFTAKRSKPKKEKGDKKGGAKKEKQDKDAAK